MRVSFHHRVTFISLLALGCGGSAPTTPPAVTPVGSWSAQTINGQSLAASGLGVTSSTLVIASNGTVVSTQVYQSAGTFVTPGTWTEARGQLAVSLDAGGGQQLVSVGTFSANTISIDWGARGYTYAYARQ